VTRLFLRDTKRASCTGWAALHPCLAARRGRLQAEILAWRPTLGNVSTYRVKTSARGTCNVRVAEGPRECVGGGAGEGPRVSYWEAWERIGGFLSFHDDI
jgi:hypothetical protein